MVGIEFVDPVGNITKAVEVLGLWRPDRLSRQRGVLGCRFGNPHVAPLARGVLEEPVGQDHRQTVQLVELTDRRPEDGSAVNDDLGFEPVDVAAYRTRTGVVVASRARFR